MNEDAENEIPQNNGVVIEEKDKSKDESEETETVGLMSYAKTGWTSYFLVVLGLLFILGLTALIANRWVNSEAEELTKALELEDKPVECKILNNQEKQNFINNQRSKIVRYGNNHRKTAIEFYGYFYATFAVFSLFGLLAAVSLAVIARKGIDGASPHLITLFFVSTGIVVLYQGFFGVFQQKANIDNNAALFVNYAKLTDKIDTYCATGKLSIIDPTGVFIGRLPKEVATKKKPSDENGENAKESPTPPSSTNKTSTFYISLEPDEFINYIGWQMEQFKAISIAIDDTKIVAIDSNKLVIKQP